MKYILSTLSLAGLLLASCSNEKTESQEKTINTTTIENKVEVSSNTGAVKYISTQQFKDEIYDFEQHPDKWVFKGDKPCLIDFYADWCGPCKQIAPYMEEIAKKYKDEINVYKVNIDNEKILANVFQVQSIPLVVWAPLNGQPGGQPGMLPKEQYMMIVDSILLKK